MPEETRQLLSRIDALENRGLLTDRQTIYIHHTIYGADARTQANYGVFWIAPFDCSITEIREVHQTAETTAATAELQIERLQGTEALDSGDALLATAFNLKGTANTVNTGSLTTTGVNLQLSRGDRLAMDDNFSAALTEFVNVTVVIELQIIKPFVNK